MRSENKSRMIFSGFKPDLNQEVSVDFIVQIIGSFTELTTQAEHLWPETLPGQ
ncbi:hypothetical protein FB99_46370 (plasmid) [Pantoea agglomerans]|nr:hypothetical protein FB99_46370 [Pantoea agglomerans]